MGSVDPEWRRFEKAVATFAATLDSSAQVRDNLRLPDRHHGGLAARRAIVNNGLVA